MGSAGSPPSPLLSLSLPSLSWIKITQTAALTVSPTILSETGALRFFQWRHRSSLPWVLCRRSKSAPISLSSPARRILHLFLLFAPFPSVPVSSPVSPPFLFALLLKLQFVSCRVGMRSRGKSSVGKTGGRLEKRLRWKRIGPGRSSNESAFPLILQEPTFEVAD